MPMPSFMRHVNKRVFNRREIRKGKRPVITHVGRSSGQTYRTPLDAHIVESGYAFILVYGANRTDWAKNVLASGRAELRAGGEDHHLVNPRIETGERAWSQIPAEVTRPPSVLNVSEILFMDRMSTE